MHEGVTIALVATGFAVVGYFLYVQQEDTQVLLQANTALVAKAVQGSQKSALSEIGDVLGLIGKAVAFL